MKLTKSMVLEVLRECEWAGRYGYYGDERACPVCEDAEPNHEPDCRLAEMIRRVEGKCKPTVFQLQEEELRAFRASMKESSGIQRMLDRR